MEEEEKRKRNEKRVSISRMKFEWNLQIGSKIGKPRPSEVFFKQLQGRICSVLPTYGTRMYKKREAHEEWRV